MQKFIIQPRDSITPTRKIAKEPNREYGGHREKLRCEIAQQVDEYLEGGGKIDKIENSLLHIKPIAKAWAPTGL
jgi:hypothetical protein